MAKNKNSRDEDSEIRGRIESLKRELEALNSGPVVSGFSAECPLEVQEQFLKDVVAFERAERSKRH